MSYVTRLTNCIKGIEMSEIAFIDDDQVTLEMVKEVLEEEGYKVDTYNSPFKFF